MRFLVMHKRPSECIGARDAHEVDKDVADQVRQSGWCKLCGEDDALIVKEVEDEKQGGGDS